MIGQGLLLVFGLFILNDPVHWQIYSEEDYNLIKVMFQNPKFKAFLVAFSRIGIGTNVNKNCYI